MLLSHIGNPAPAWQTAQPMPEISQSFLGQRDLDTSEIYYNLEKNKYQAE